MRDEQTREEPLATVFLHVADGKLNAVNFGNTLIHAINGGVYSKEKIAKIMDIDYKQIRHVGNSLRARDIRKIAQALTRERSRNVK